MRWQGLTLVELVVVLALLVVLAGMALPRFGEMLARMRLRNAAQALWGDFMLARTKAIERGISCGIKLDKDAEQYMVFCDENGNQAYDAGEELKTVSLGEAYKKVEISYTNRDVFLFDRRGLPAGFNNGNCTLALEDGSSQVSIIISSLGRIKIE